MSGCEYYQELISRMCDEELSGEEKTALAEHLKDCPECTLMYSAFAGLSEMIKDDMVEAPESIRINVMAELRRDEIKKKSAARRKRLLRVAAAAACLVLVVGVGVSAMPKLKKDSSAVAGVAMNFAAPAAAAPAAGEPEVYAEEAAPAEAAPAEVTVMEETAETETAIAALNDEGAVSQSKFGLFSADRNAVLEYIPSWEELSALLQGVDAEIEAADISVQESFIIRFTLNGEPTELEFMICEGMVLYTDPTDGTLKKLGCGLEALNLFIS